MQPWRISQTKSPPMARVPGTGTTPSYSSFMTHFAGKKSIFPPLRLECDVCVLLSLSVWSQERLAGPASSSFPLIRSDSVISQASGNSCTQHNKHRTVKLKEQHKG